VQVELRAPVTEGGGVLVDPADGATTRDDDHLREAGEAGEVARPTSTSTASSGRDWKKSPLQ
jgi:hypothetical protein